MKTTAILFTLPIEATPFLRRHHHRHIEKNFFECYIGGNRVIVCMSGIGGEQVESEASKLLSSKPQALIITGFAGALDDSLATGQVIAANSVLHADSKYSSDAELLQRAKAQLKDESEHTLVTVDEVVHSTEKKLLLNLASGCCAVDMESAFAASIAQRTGVPFLVVRSISDDCNCSISSIFAESMRSDGNPDIGYLLMACFRRPSTIPAAIRLGIQTKRAADSLSCFLTDYLEG